MPWARGEGGATGGTPPLAGDRHACVDQQRDASTQLTHAAAGKRDKDRQIDEDREGEKQVELST